MRTLGEVIKSLRLEKHLSQEQFAKLFDVATSTVGMWENNKRSPNEETKEAIADYFNVDMNYLYGKTPIRNSYREGDLDNWADEDPFKLSGIDFFRLPLLPPVCCGNGGFADDNIIEYVPVPSKGLSNPSNYFCQIAQGDSMKDAGIDDGDLLVFEKTSSVYNGMIGAFCVDENEAMCKKYTEVNGMIILQPMNSDYDPIPVDPLNEHFRCVGKLKKSIKNFNE